MRGFTKMHDFAESEKENSWRTGSYRLYKRTFIDDLDDHRSNFSETRYVLRRDKEDIKDLARRKNYMGKASVALVIISRRAEIGIQ
jgi:hypothetical protein